jgi:hypothetical protein
MFVPVFVPTFTLKEMIAKLCVDSQWPNAANPKLDAKAKKESRRCLEQERELADQDIQYLSKLLSKYYRSWD